MRVFIRGKMPKIKEKFSLRWIRQIAQERVKNKKNVDSFVQFYQKTERCLNLISLPEISV